METDSAPAATAVADFLASGTFNADRTITYAYDDNDRLLVEKLDSDASGSVDQTTVYQYGPNNLDTQQTARPPTAAPTRPRTA